MAKAQMIEEDRKKAEQEQQMAEIDRKMKELEFQERQAGIDVNIQLPEGDEATKLMLRQSLLRSILQVQELKGLELALPDPLQIDENKSKEDTEQ